MRKSHYVIGEMKNGTFADKVKTNYHLGKLEKFYHITIFD